MKFNVDVKWKANTIGPDEGTTKTPPLQSSDAEKYLDTTVAVILATSEKQKQVNEEKTAKPIYSYRKNKLLVVGSAVVRPNVVGSAVVGASVAASGVVGSRVVGSAVVGPNVVGSEVVGASVVASGVVGPSVVGSGVVGPGVVGAAVIGSATKIYKINYQFKQIFRSTYDKRDSHQTIACPVSLQVSSISPNRTKPL